MALVRQLTTAGFKPISKYEYIVHLLSVLNKQTNELSNKMLTETNIMSIS